MADSTIEETIRRVLSARKKVAVQDQSLMPAAVLLLLYPKDGEYCILLQKRTDGVEHHKGEISLPGGSRDLDDRDFLDTALREVHEEMGIRPEAVTVLGDLDDVVTRSQFGIRVFVGTIPYPYPFKPSPVEIAEVLEVPVAELLSSANRREEVRWVDGRVSKAYSYAYKEHLIFGATAQIITQFLELLPDAPELSHSEQ
jgi:8-oxo-dGTP pyrophosphatase MutT (NUDIX family)